MFEVQHEHHGKNFTRYFSPGRSSMTALDDKKAEDFRRHVWAMTMIDEDPLAGRPDRHSTGLTYPPAPNKLKSKRRASTHGPTWNENDEKQLEDLKKDPKPVPFTTMKGPTVSVQPLYPTSFAPVAERYPVKDDPIDDFLGKSKASNTNPAAPRNSPQPSYSIYPGPDTLSHVALYKASESRPDLMSARPRNLSNTSSISTSSMYSSLESPRSTAWSNRTSIESSYPSPSQWRPEYMYQRPMPLKKRRQYTARPNEMFAKLPSEVLGLVLENLKDLHLDPKSFSCATCWMRDVCNISLSSRKWCKVARIALYEDIQLAGPDSAVQKKKYKLNQGVRVMMLRRTLRANPLLAAIVRSVKVPAPETPSKGSAPKGAGLDEYDNLIASIVMACPNLERLNGLNPVYDHAFKRIFHALSSRTQLKEMHWLIQVSPHQQRPSSSSQQLGLMMPGELLPFQERTFLDHHQWWKNLETLTIHCLPGATLTPENLLTDTLNYLPSLKHLHLCNVPPNGFNDTNLLNLPQLRTLTLSHITGITSAGLSSFATRSNSISLRKLQLRHTPLTSLPALARMFSNLRSLTSFSLIQAFPPIMPEDDVFALWMMPYLASSSLKKLHWDITGRTTSVNRADDILAKSMAAGGFPELHSLRILNDPEGVFQNFCHPVARIDLPSDRFRNSEPIEMVNSTTSSPQRNLFKSSSQSSLPSSRPSSAPSNNPPPYTNLQSSRLAAQSRLENAHQKPRFTVNIIDEDGTITNTFHLAGFIGTPGSKIRYHLLPDAGSGDKTGGLLDVRDLGGDGGESLSGGKEGCTGRWNLDAEAMADRKERDRWWHTERGRWSKLEL